MWRNEWVRDSAILEKQKNLAEKNKLTNSLIKKLTYYGLAIRRNVDSVERMKNAIIGTLYHLYSTNLNPRHENCPEGADSWCKWQKAKATGNEKDFNHPPPLHPDIEKHL